MASFQQAIKQIVIANIALDGYKEHGYNNLREIYMAEYGMVNGIRPQACTSYLQGLPSVCTIPFNNFEILQLLEAAGFTKPTEKGRSGLIDKYWKEAGNQFYKLIK